MKIIQVLNHFLPNQTAGTEIYVWALSKALQSYGHEVKILIPNYGSESSSCYIHDGLIVHQFAEPSIIDKELIMGFRVPDGLPFFTSFINGENPDLIHFHELAGSNGIGISHVRAAKNFGAKIVMTFHLAGYSCQTSTLMYMGKTLCDGKINKFKCSSCFFHKNEFNYSSNLLASASTILDYLKVDSIKWMNSFGTALGTAAIITRLEKKLYELVDICDQVICISDWYHQVLRVNGINEKKISYIGQGLPTPFSISTERKKNKPLKLMFLGRISHFKGLHLLIDAISTFSEETVELSIFGRTDGTNYENSLRKKTINKVNIHWRGVLEQSSVQFEMNKHDLLCLCSTFSEMSPLVIQEARAAGLPILASNVQGNVEQISHEKNGFLFDFNDVASLKKQITRILNETTILDKIKSNKFIQRSFNEVADDYLILFNNLFINE